MTCKSFPRCSSRCLSNAARRLAMAATTAVLGALLSHPLRAQAPTRASWSLHDVAARLGAPFPNPTCRDEIDPTIAVEVRRCIAGRAAPSTDSLALLFEQRDSLTGVFWNNRRFPNAATAKRFVDSVAVELSDQHFERWACPDGSGSGVSTSTHVWTGHGSSVHLTTLQRGSAPVRVDIAVLADEFGTARTAFCPAGRPIQTRSPSEQRGFAVRRSPPSVQW
jgi:hypothetical protein